MVEIFFFTTLKLRYLSTIIIYDKKIVWLIDFLFFLLKMKKRQSIHIICTISNCDNNNI